MDLNTVTVKVIAGALLVALVVLASVSLVSRQQNPSPTPQSVMYAPVILAYENGTYLGLKEFEAPTDTVDACKAKIAVELTKIAAGAPPDAQLTGRCVAIPKADLPGVSLPEIRHEQDGTI